MKLISSFFRSLWDFIRSPKEELQKKAPFPGYSTVFVKTSIPILIGYFFAHLSFKTLGLQYVFLGGSIPNMLTRAILPDLFLGTLYALLFNTIYLSVGIGVLWGISKIFSYPFNTNRGLELSSKLSYSFLILGILIFFGFTGIFGSIVYLIFFIYFSFLVTLTLFYGLGAGQRISIIFGLIIGLISYGIFFLKDDTQMDNLTLPSQPETMTPEEEREKIQEAEDVIRKLEEARKEKGYND
ncbi:hypothetical protein [Leptospira licerasiae]|uniref:YIP1 family protein n=1 Tax=Leptospira licerasiae str. MMD4847 TaxID=1049971 RepID=A0ABN0HEL4_9LEPT|nr:hypothetical protein [Leptospira licerasiae]EIE01236.1 hypothetical protein LEP1GSC185_3594 [Leptospira licerasiae serovar Varillal str. VAR 010]EJZ44071.1 hypothetical protein LEP1GSC178_2301 [Leptospira licerasiae str. MMD4847]